MMLSSEASALTSVFVKQKVQITTQLKIYSKKLVNFKTIPVTRGTKSIMIITKQIIIKNIIFVIAYGDDNMNNNNNSKYIKFISVIILCQLYLKRNKKQNISSRLCCLHPVLHYFYSAPTLLLLPGSLFQLTAENGAFRVYKALGKQMQIPHDFFWLFCTLFGGGCDSLTSQC